MAVTIPQPEVGSSTQAVLRVAHVNANFAGGSGAIMLREAGFDAKYMKGGHSAWKAIGGAIKPIAEESQENEV